MQLDFTEKKVLVVGGTSGINRGIAESFAKAGAKVAVASRSEEKVQNTVDALKKETVDALGFVADVRNFEQLEEEIQKVATQWGNFDVVVSGAAGNFPALANAMSPKGFKAVVDIDLMGTYHVMRAVYPFLTKPGACVINVSAPQAIVPMIAQSHVCAAKAGVDMITRTLALEWGPEGIRINSIIPGPIEGTEGMSRLAPGETLQKACIHSVPLRRMGTKEDIANACLMLASPLASFIHGTVLPVDGGWVNGGVASLGSMLGEMLQ